MTRPRPKKLDHLLQAIQECINGGNYRDTTHAVQRQKERKILLPEIIHVLQTGIHEKNNDHFEEAFQAWNYAIRGLTIDGLNLRVIISFDNEKDLLIITAFYLEKRK